MQPTAEGTADARKRRESQFWDAEIGRRVAMSSGAADQRAMPDEVKHEAAYQFYLDALGDLEGKRVLECGCGEGKLSVLLAARGAQVWAIDISPGSVDLCRRRAESWEVEQRLAGALADAERLPFAEGAFDVVCGTFVLHHVDVPTAAAQIRRVLVPGGRAVFLENSADNPILMFGRRRLVGRFGIERIGSADESPFASSQLQAFAPLFERVERHFPQMVFFRLALFRLVLAALPVKRFPRGPLRSLGNWLWNAGPRLDDAMYRLLPGLRRYSWWQVLMLSGAEGTEMKRD